MTKLNELPVATGVDEVDLILIQQGGVDKQAQKNSLNKETIFTISHDTVVDIDPSKGGIQVWSLSSSSSVTFNNFLEGQSVTLMITAGANTVTWPTMNWVGGSEPTLSTTEQTVVELWKVASTLYGAIVGDVA